MVMRFEEIKQKLRNKTVGIAGAGGLGSNCAVALVRSGVGRPIIADFDVVSAGNLNRQCFFRDQIGMKKVKAMKMNLMRIDPSIPVEAMDVFLNAGNIPEIFRSCDVIVEAFDLAEMKQMIIETVLAEMPHIPLIAGIGLAGWGDTESIGVKRDGNLYICGDGRSEAGEEHPPLAPRVGIVANMQANLALEILLGKYTKDEDNTQ